MDRKIISSSAKWEDQAGYSRAVRVGNHVWIAGTAAIDGDQVIGEGDARVQAIFILQKIQKALAEAGAKLEHVVKTRIYISRRDLAETVTKVHGDFFKDIKPVTTLLVVEGFILEEFLVEIEAEALIHD